MTFTCRQIILAMIISSANIIFGDILVQPGYEHQYSHNPSYLPYQTASRYKVSSAAEQHAKQLATQPLKQYPSGVRIVHPYYVPEVHQDKVRSNLMGYPFHLLHHYPLHHYVSTKPAHTLPYVKLAREYMQPSVFIAHSNPLVAHYRHKRSTDFTNVKSNIPAIATHDVATKPSLIDAKYSTAIDSLLPESKSTDTNDKHVKTQSDFAANSFLFGLNPNKMYSKLKTENLDDKKDETQHPISKRNHATLITPLTPLILTQPFTSDSTKATVTEPAQQTSSSSQKKGPSQEPSPNHEDPHLTPKPSSTNLEQSMSPITISQESEEESQEDDSKYYNDYRTFTLPITSIAYRPTIPFVYKFWPSYITYDTEMHPSKKKYLDQQNIFNYLTRQSSNQTSSQETTNFGATNIDQPKNRELTTHLCAGGIPCSISNIKKPPSESISNIPILTPEQSPTYSNIRKLPSEPISNMPTLTPEQSPTYSNIRKLPSEPISNMPTLTPEQSPTYFYKNKEFSPRNEMISAPNPGTPQVFYAIPDDSVNYYFNDYQDSMKDYLDNLETDYPDYDDKSTFLNDGFNLYLKKNSAYSSNVPSNKIDYYNYDNILYRNSNPQRNVAPLYVVPISSQMRLSDYYPKKARKAYATYKPQHYYKDYIYDTKNQIVPNVYYRRAPYSPPVYY
ncbi:flocculation protein FLO11 [Camponotus floridanus]|uniref:flocculation protein FLO11 n=1 Tax=Camponotus floridanus TaxID=104421 RepID=UPI000DC6A5BD|nr:flocculation protein FLO11 [Camponotus floridanus]